MLRYVAQIGAAASLLACALGLFATSSAAAQDAAILPASAPAPADAPAPTSEAPLEESVAPDAAPAPAATAEVAPPDDAIQVTVVGTPLARTAGSAHVVRSTQLERFKHDDPHAVLTAVPGVYVRGEDGYGLRPNIGIRGVNPDRSKKVTLMEDGVLVGPAPYSAPAAYFFPMMARMTQVRVVKGPGSVSFGPQTVGGAIDLITRPIPDSTAAAIDLAGGSHGYRKAHGHFGSSDGQLGFLIEGLHLSTDGFKELPNAADTGFYRNEWMVKGAYTLDPNADVQNELRIKLVYSDELSNESYLGLSDEDFEDNPLRRYAASALDRMRNHRTSIVATHVLTPSEAVSLTTNAYRNDFYRVWRKVNHFADAGAGGGNLFDVLTSRDDANEGYLDLLRGETDSEGPLDRLFIGPNERDFSSQGLETRLRWDATTGVLVHRMEYGLRFHADRVDRRHSEDAFELFGGDPVPAGVATRVTAANNAWSYALAAHATDAITWQALTLTPGVRVEAIYSGFENRDPAGALPLETTRWAHALVPGLGAYYAITPELGVLAGVYRGFTPPEPGSDSDVEPELSWNYEAGTRYTRGAARAELIGFYNDYQNLTDTCTFSRGCSDESLDRQFDAGEARIYGLEAFFDYAAPLPAAFKLPITLAYTLTATEFLSTFESQDPIYDMVEEGDELPYVPRHQLMGSLGLEHARAGGNVSATYVAAMREEPGDEPIEDVLATDEQLVFDVALYYRAESMPLELYAIAHNVFDSAYIVSRRPYGARPNAPLSVQVGVKLEL